MGLRWDVERNIDEVWKKMAESTKRVAKEVVGENYP